MTLIDIATEWQAVITAYVVLPVLILLLGIFIGKVLEQIILFVMQEVAPKKPEYRKYAYMTAWIVYIATGAYALESIHLFTITLWFVLGVIAAVILISLLLGARDFLINFFGYRAAQKKCKQGATIRTRYGEGTVVHVMLLETHIKTKEGDDIFIPNGTVRTLKIEKA